MMATKRTARRAPKGKPTRGPEKKLLLAISEDQWAALKQIALNRRQTLKGVCLDAFDLLIAKYAKRD